MYEMFSVISSNVIGSNVNDVSNTLQTYSRRGKYVAPTITFNKLLIGIYSSM